MKKILYILCLALSLSSCEKVIDLKLKNTDPRLVVTGEFNDVDVLHRLTLTKTVNYDAANNFPIVENATVYLKDNLGNIDTLQESAPGIYDAIGFSGVTGRTYELTINDNGTVYSSVSTMPAPINIDSVYAEVIATPFGRELPVVTTVFQDEPNNKNYYYLRYKINNDYIDDFIFFSDDLQNGETIEASTFSEEYFDVENGDTITVEMQHINAAMYQHLLTLEELEGAGGFGGTTPNNPTSNITSNALGYYNVYSKTSYDLIIDL